MLGGSVVYGYIAPAPAPDPHEQVPEGMWFLSVLAVTKAVFATSDALSAWFSRW